MLISQCLLCRCCERMPARWRRKVLSKEGLVEEEGLLEEVHHSSRFANPVYDGAERQLSALGLRLELMVLSAKCYVSGMQLSSSSPATEGQNVLPSSHHHFLKSEPRSKQDGQLWAGFHQHSLGTPWLDRLPPWECGQSQTKCGCSKPFLPIPWQQRTSHALCLFDTDIKRVSCFPEASAQLHKTCL